MIHLKLDDDVIWQELDDATNVNEANIDDYYKVNADIVLVNDNVQNINAKKDDYWDSYKIATDMLDK